MSTIKAKRQPLATGRRGNESALVTSALTAIGMLVRDGVFWRNNSGMMTTPSGGIIRLAPAGTADILGILGPDGIFIGLEAKVPSRKSNVSDLQKEWIKKINSLGGYAGVFCTVDEALEHIEKARQQMALKRSNSR